MSGKNLVLFLKSFPYDASTRFGPFEWSIWVSANFSRFGHRIDSILHILIELNGAHELAMISLMLDHSKIRKNAFLNDPNKPKTRFSAIFLSLVPRIDLILHILIELNGVHELAIVSPMLDHWKTRKMPFWMIQIAKKEVFGHFLEFGLLDRLDIAYCDSTKCFPTFGNVTRSWRIIQRS